MKPIILALFLLGSSMAGSALAQTASNPYPKVAPPIPNPRVAQLEMALNHVQQEQQAVYQQFQMTQELRRNEIQQNYPQGIQPADSMAAYAMGGLKDNPPQSYDDNVRMQRERQERIEQYTRDLNRLYSRYAELGEQKRVLLDQLIDLAK
ncbi:uncharacterized protein YutE (UPF0331/DUF86 family) [Nitrosospira sp. Nsp5]|uniref:Uncharacterized conserved protein YutE, UPF0331/DUF86 family n=1 Tax=Nitrosospira multiformis TaxID=1231 RepID=A0ABY0TIZ8_9PROT|nr:MULTISPECIES: hypothetical protein [Nitrosospira]PTR10541.1 uncharacterized protein YutE (UPF0331/DUF86 family) [Nitrosospira sp. Nsp5]SDQ81319.1 Uncharacterized conserved protein YutE, UPF0331/DUF86 family [Nitrosospira multiformis]